MIRKAKLTKDQLARIYALHGHSSGKGLSIYDVHNHEKVNVTNPIFIEHTNGKRRTIIAQGYNKDGQRVSQMVKHT